MSDLVARLFALGAGGVPEATESADEIEDLQGNMELQQKDLNSFKGANDSALQEILQHLERIVKEYVSKDEMNRDLEGIKSRLYNDLENTMATISQ